MYCLCEVVPIFVKEKRKKVKVHSLSSRHNRIVMSRKKDGDMLLINVKT